MFCTACGFKLEDGDVFCTNCGTRVEPVVPVAAAAVSAPAGGAAANMTVAVTCVPVATATVPVASEPVASAPVAAVTAFAANAPAATATAPAASVPAASAPAASAPANEEPYLGGVEQAAMQATVNHYDYRPIADYDETSVLPEYPDEADTTVQPGGIAGYQQETAETTVLTGGNPASMGGGAQAYEQETAETTVLSQQVQQQAQPQPTQQQYAPAPVTAQWHQLSLRLTRRNGDTCVLAGYPTVVGTAQDCNLIIDDNRSISRHHVRILRDGNVFAAEDLGSSNKTYIGDYCLPPSVPTILTDGDVLRLGSEVLRVSIFK